MIQRRQIRILAPYSKMFYFVDRGAQRGLAYDLGRMFEDDLNQKLQNKNIRVHVVFVPVARDQIIPSLLKGRGDIAMANLTITPERRKQVDFTEPTRRNVAEIVVTGPASAPIATAQALSGQRAMMNFDTSEAPLEPSYLIRSVPADAGDWLTATWLNSVSAAIDGFNDLTHHRPVIQP